MKKDQLKELIQQTVKEQMEEMEIQPAQKLIEERAGEIAYHLQKEIKQEVSDLMRNPEINEYGLKYDEVVNIFAKEIVSSLKSAFDVDI